jgi:hypothetical protein
MDHGLRFSFVATGNLPVATAGSELAIDYFMQVTKGPLL